MFDMTILNAEVIDGSGGEADHADIGIRGAAIEAIRRFTSQPADQCCIEHRGLVKEGYYADLLIMEPERFRTRSTFSDPCHYPEGLHMVIINGKVLLEDGEYRPDSMPGMMLRKNSQRAPGSVLRGPPGA